MAVKITGVKRRSPAEKAGIKNGDLLLSINGHGINDVLDYMFYIAEENVKIEVLRDNETLIFNASKSEYDDIGLTFDSFLMDEQKPCRNNCIFCFIDQNPRGLRETLYFKDDDARLSFLQGNYITLTNLTDTDIERIIKMKLNINISLHTMNPDLRVKIMRNRFAGEKLRYLKDLTDGGIQLNIQLVLMPEINDGEELEFTLTKLFDFAENINSIACVPVGLTAHREGLPELKLFDKFSAARVINTIHKWQEKFSEKTGFKTVFAADEFFLTAGLPIPDEDYYEDYPQYQNGVGMIRSFTDSFLFALETFKCQIKINPKKYLIATGTAAYPFMSELIKTAKEKFPQIDCDVKAINNTFFGETITVSGLLTGTDLYSQLEGRITSDRVLLLTEYMFRKDSEEFLDNSTKTELEEKLSVKIEVFPDDGEALFKIITS
ncbi:MAG: DUF512 domain-containing protein [Ruminococcus sp.]|jgi:putative radical SAM enzyme (TIGR03279 family)|nr:DUF512 domain-containing protein [Ruminococcus sp.]